MMTAQQLDTLAAMVNRIVPPDDFPGGWDAGVGDYLRRQLEGGDLSSQLPLYQTGLDALAQEPGGFAGLPAQAQDEVLRRIEAGQFFQNVVSHTMEGFYADPGNGGNRDGVSWKMIGYEVRG